MTVQMIVLLDMNTRFWLSSPPPVVLKGLLTFFSSFLMDHPSACLSVQLFSSVSNQQIFPLDNDLRLVQLMQYRDIQSVIKQRLIAWLSSAPQDRQPSRVAPVLSRALCQVNKSQETAPPRQTIINIISCNPPSQHEYISFINCAYAALKQDVRINILELEDTSYLPIGAQITNGYHTALEKSLHTGVLQLLLQFYMMDLESSKYIDVPKQQVIDQKATCFCCQEVIQEGFACSLCLAIYCDKTQQQQKGGCEKCQHRYDIIEE